MFEVALKRFESPNEGRLFEKGRLELVSWAPINTPRRDDHGPTRHRG
jgi:hypothetical protein